MSDQKVLKSPDCPNAVLDKVANAAGATIEREKGSREVSILFSTGRRIYGRNNTAILQKMAMLHRSS